MPPAQGGDLRRSESDVKLEMLDSYLLDRMQGAHVECENPNAMLYRFEGTLNLGSIAVPLNTDQLLLRGSSLRNTEFIYGLVVFTGHETKIMKNSVGARAKFSKLELATNTYIFLIVMIQLCVAIVGSIFNTVWQVVNRNELNAYLDLDAAEGYGPFMNWIVQLGTWFLMFVNIVPISLMVTLEIVKFIQALFIIWDASIYDEEKDMPTKA